MMAVSILPHETTALRELFYLRKTHLFEMVTWQVQNAWPSHLITTSVMT